MTIVYWVYALLAVPLIEPSYDGRLSTSGISEADRENAKRIADAQVDRVRKYFPPGGLESLGLTEPKILESNQAKLLFQSYEHHRDGSVALRPCVIVFDPGGASGRSGPVILEAPGGAILRFDPPLDLNHVKIGRLAEGQLAGEVRIRSDWKLPGPEDDLLVVTRDIKLTENTIFTPHPVDFRWGPHFGRGRDMTIRLLAGETRADANTAGPNIEGVESFELRHVERLRIDLGQGIGTEGQAAMPVEISCRGPFRFDVLNRVATFSERVDVMKPNPGGPADQIACDVLAMHFVERKGVGSLSSEASAETRAVKTPDPLSKTLSKKGTLDLVAERLECRGRPVVVTAPSRKLNARAPRIEYNLLAEAITLDGDQDVFLQQGSNEIHARSLFYQLDKHRSIGQLLAQGPGRLRGKLDESTGQLLEAVWNNRLQIYPHNQKHVVSLDGGAELKHQGIGQLQAREIFFWLDAAPAVGDGGKPGGLRPDRMLARDNVRLNSPQLSAKTAQLEVWFEQIGSAYSEQGGGAQSVGNSPEILQIVQSGAAQPAETGVPRRFEVAGRLLRVRALLGGPQIALSNLLVVDGVSVREVQTALAGEKPLLISGDMLEVSNATEPTATAKLVGKPALFEARGLALAGSNINLDRGANRLWIDGAGRMDLPIPENLSNQTPAAPGDRLAVEWKNRMDFDGLTAKFEESVVASGPAQQLRAKRMEAWLRRRIDFSQADVPDNSEIEEIRCFGDVALENRRFDERRQLAAFDRVQVADLAVNARSGAVTAGPGWFNSVSLGAAEAPLNPLAPAAGQPNAAAKPPGEQLYCLTVRYQGSLAGNLKRQQLTFNTQVRTARAPVDDWNAMLNTDNPDALGPNGVSLRCDKLSVVEMPTPLKNQRSVEVEALGNTVVEGKTYTARGHRISYAEAKDLLILEGDGRGDAELFRQIKVGVPPSKVAARKILYWPKTNRLKLDGAKSLEISLFPESPGAK